MITENFEVRNTVRIARSHSAYDGVKNLVYLLHGYGQLAPSFIRKFEMIDKPENLLLAPEAPYRYYVDHRSKRVGATWMTREERLQDIADYVHYLDSLDEEISTRLKHPVRRIILGFSQGVATATRWINQGKVVCDDLVMWGGIYPPDLLPEGRLIHEEPRTIALFGTKDPLISEESLAHFESHIERLGLHPERMSYDGVHEIDAAALSVLAVKLSL